MSVTHNDVALRLAVGSSSRKVVESDVNYDALATLTFRAAVRGCGLVLLIAILYFVASWEMSVYDACHAEASETVARAIDLRDSFCQAEVVDRSLRSARSISQECVRAHHTIVDGVPHIALDCIATRHMAHLGACKEFALCEAVVSWIDTLRQHMWMLILFATACVVYGISKAYTNVASESTIALRALKMYRSAENTLLPSTSLSDEMRRKEM